MKTADIHYSEIFISTLKTGAVRSSEALNFSSVKSWPYKPKHGEIRVIFKIQDKRDRMSLLVDSSTQWQFLCNVFTGRFQYRNLSAG
jgi:hypothetical protein